MVHKRAALEHTPALIDAITDRSFVNELAPGRAHDLEKQEYGIDEASVEVVADVADSVADGGCGLDDARGCCVSQGEPVV